MLFFSKPISLIRSLRDRRKEQEFLHNILPQELDRLRQLLDKRLDGSRKRVAIVKQDCNEDLYCCPPGLPAWDTISSTLLRSGPVDFFTLFNASFILLRTEADPECNIWYEKVDPLGWAPRQWFENFRDHVPGRDYGQSLYSQSAEQINWSDFDLVISIDVSVPARITRQYPGVVWCYYVREIKAPSWQSSLRAPLTGQDLFLSQRFAPLLGQKEIHVVDFPYHFQHVGVFHQLVPSAPAGPDENVRKGVFVEYHSAIQVSDEQLRALSAFGPVYAYRDINSVRDPLNGERIPDRTMAGPALEALLNSKYHVKWAGRPTFGTAKVEAICAGCVCLTDPAIDGTTFLHSPASLVHGFDGLLHRLESLELNHASYIKELRLQRQRVDYLCCYRPANDLLDACERVLNRLK